MRLRQALVAAAHSGEALQGAGGSGAVVGHPVACWLKYGGQCGPPEIQIAVEFALLKHADLCGQCQGFPVQHWQRYANATASQAFYPAARAAVATVGHWGDAHGGITTASSTAPEKAMKGLPPRIAR